jgi:hypothetical protein
LQSGPEPTCVKHLKDVQLIKTIGSTLKH